MATTYKSTKNIPENYTLRKQIGSITFKRQPKGTYTDKNEPFNYNEYLKKYYEYNAAYQLQNPQSGYNLTTFYTTEGGGGGDSRRTPTEKGMPPWSTGTEYSYPGSPNITGKSTTEISWNIVREVLPKQYEVLKTYVDNPDTKQVEGQAWFAIDKAYLDSIFPFETQKDAVTSINVIRDPYAPVAQKQEAADNIAYLIVSSNPEIGNRVANLQPGDSRTWNDLLGNPKEQASWSLYSQDIQFPIYILLNSEDVNLSKYDSDGLTAAYTKLQSGEAFSYQDAQNLLDIYGRVMTPDNLRVIDSNKYYYSNIKEITNMSTKLQNDPFGLAQHQNIMQKVKDGIPFNKEDMQFIATNSNGTVDYDKYIKDKTASINQTNQQIMAESKKTTTTPPTPEKPPNTGTPPTDEVVKTLTTEEGRALVEVFVQGKAADMLLVERRTALGQMQSDKRTNWLTSDNPLKNIVGLANTQVPWSNYNPTIAANQSAFSWLGGVLDDTTMFQNWQDLYYQSRAGGSSGNLIVDLSVGFISGVLDPLAKTGAGVNLALDPENPTVADIGSCIVEAVAGAYIGKALTYAAKADIPIISKTAQTTIKVSNTIHDFLGRIPVIGRVFSSADDKAVQEFDENFMESSFKHKVTGQGYDAPNLKVETKSEVNARWGSGKSGQPTGFDALTQKPVSHGRVNLDRTLVFDKDKGWVKFNEFSGNPIITDDGTYLKGLNKDGVPKYVNASEYGVKTDYQKAGSNSVWDDVKQTFVPKTETPISKTDVPNSPKNTTYLENKPPQPTNEKGLIGSIVHGSNALARTTVGKAIVYTTIGATVGTLLTAPQTVAFLAWGACDNVVKDGRNQLYMIMEKNLDPGKIVDRLYDNRNAYNRSVSILGTIAESPLMKYHPTNVLTRVVFDYDSRFLPIEFKDKYGEFCLKDDFEDYGVTYGYITKTKTGEYIPASFDQFQAFWNSKSDNEIRALFKDYYGRTGVAYQHFVGQYLQNPDKYNEQVFKNNKDGLGNQRFSVDANGNVTANATNTTYKGQGVGTGAGILQPSTGIIPTSATSTNFNEINKEDLTPQQQIAFDVLKDATDVSQVEKAARDLGIDYSGSLKFSSDKSVEGQKMAVLNTILENEKSPFTIDRRDKTVYAPPMNQERSNYFKKVDTPETIKWDSKYIPQAATYGGAGAFRDNATQQTPDPSWSANLPTNDYDRPWLNEGQSVFDWNWTPPPANFNPQQAARDEAARISQAIFTPTVVGQGNWGFDNWTLAELIAVINYDPMPKKNILELAEDK